MSPASQVHQDEVDQQCQEVDRETSADEQKHVEAQHFEDYGICQIILCIFKRTPHEPCPVVHGDVKVPVFCAILHFSGSEMRWLLQNPYSAASLDVTAHVYVPIQRCLQRIKITNQEDMQIFNHLISEFQSKI